MKTKLYVNLIIVFILSVNSINAADKICMKSLLNRILFREKKVMPVYQTLSIETLNQYLSNRPNVIKVVPLRPLLKDFTSVETDGFKLVDLTTPAEEIGLNFKNQEVRIAVIDDVSVMIESQVQIVEGVLKKVVMHNNSTYFLIENQKTKKFSLIPTRSESGRVVNLVLTK